MTIPTQAQIELLSKDFQIRLAIFAAELVLDRVEPQHKAAASKAIEVTKLYLEGKATREDCRVAADAAYAAAADAANAGYAAAHAAHAAYGAYTAYTAAYGAYTAYTAAVYAYYAIKSASEANPKVVPKIVAYYEELRDFDKNFERDVLGGENA